MQAEILDRYPDFDIAVYAVWFNMLPSDGRAEWDDDLLTDPRVLHYWDQDRVAGRWFADHVGFSHGSVAWDVYYLYGPDAAWEDTPQPLISSGYTLFGERDRLSEEMDRLLDQ